MNIFLFIVLFTLGQGYALAFFLLSSKFYRSKANNWLALFAILVSTMSIVDIIGGHYQTNSLWAEFILSDLSIDFLVYVPLYIYFQLSATSSGIKPRTIFLLFLPFVLNTLLNLYIALNLASLEDYSDELLQTYYDVESIVIILFNLFLTYKSYQVINQSTAPKKKKWLLNVWSSSFVIFIVFTVIIIVTTFTGVEFYYLLLITYALVALWLFWMIYSGVVNLNLIDDRDSIKLKLAPSPMPAEPTVTVEWPQQEAKAPPKAVSNEKTKRNTIDHHFQIIDKLVAKEYLYRNEDLSIDEVSERVGLSVSYVSQIVNQITGMNFPSWINTFRVAEVKGMLTDQDFESYTVLAIGLEAGFKSKSAFYATFKKKTGLTPTQYRKNKS